MHCPHRLEPHQIQGLDFIHIYPVVQWLVKKAIETREERQQEIRNRAMHEFAKRGKTPLDKAFEDALPTAMASTDRVKDSYKPRRQFRAPDTTSRNEETRVHTTLLEYGRRYGMSRKPAGDGGDSKKAKVAQSLGEGEGEEDLAQMEEERIRALMSGMSEADGADVSQAAIVSVLGRRKREGWPGSAMGCACKWLPRAEAPVVTRAGVPRSAQA